MNDTRSEPVRGMPDGNNHGFAKLLLAELYRKYSSNYIPTENSQSTLKQRVSPLYMQRGHFYVGVTCHNCNQKIALIEIQVSESSRDVPINQLSVECVFCKTVIDCQQQVAIVIECR